MKRILVLFMLFASLAGPRALSAPAQAEPSPLLRMLAFAPDTRDIRAGEVSYVDFQALVSSQRGAAQPKNYQEWLAIQSQKTPGAGRFMAALRGISVGSADLALQFARPEGMVKALGIDPFTIQRILSIGTPPSTALVLDGTFDPAAIGQALETKKYQKQPDLGSFALWCSVDGCDTGTKLNPAGREPGNPFGGNLGRKQPIAASTAQVFSSASYPLMQTMAKATGGRQASLAATPEYLSSAEAFMAAGTVLQVYFLNPKSTKDAFTLPVGAQAGALKEFIEKAKAEFVPIPAYSLVTFAHVVNEDSELAMVALVYDSESDAKTAQDVILSRISKYQSLVTRRPLMELIKERQGTLETPQIYASQSTGKHVLVFTLSAPRQPGDATPDSNQVYPASGLLFRLLVNSAMRRDLGWLAIEFGGS
jgi:hypothetical protein